MNNIRKGDKVLFLLPNYPVYDQEGKDIFEKLKPGNIYTVKEIGIISLSLKEIEGGYLIKHFIRMKKQDLRCKLYNKYKLIINEKI